VILRPSKALSIELPGRSCQQVMDSLEAARGDGALLGGLEGNRFELGGGPGVFPDDVASEESMARAVSPRVRGRVVAGEGGCRVEGELVPSPYAMLGLAVAGMVATVMVIAGALAGIWYAAEGRPAGLGILGGAVLVALGMVGYGWLSVVRGFNRLAGAVEAALREALEG
jgi:hypothetical protein